MVSSNCKLDLSLGQMVIRGEEVRKVNLSEVSVLIIESTAVSVTAMLLCELTRRKIKVVFCDERHNPYGELEPYYGSHDSPSKLREQVKWTEHAKQTVWAEIVREKISKQADLLACFDYERASMLRGYSEEVQPGDSTNREGHAAKVYFNSLFGVGFTRKKECATNVHLNYGYSILLSAVNREIVSLGYSTQLGMHHDNTFNQFNLGSDIMEPLRPMVDSMVLDMPEEVTIGSKHEMANILNHVVEINGKHQYLNNAMGIYVKSVTDALDADDVGKLRFCQYERKGDEADCVLRPAGDDG